MTRFTLKASRKVPVRTALLAAFAGHGGARRDALAKDVFKRAEKRKREGLS